MTSTSYYSKTCGCVLLTFYTLSIITVFGFLSKYPKAAKYRGSLQGEQLRESIIQCQILKNSAGGQGYEMTTVTNLRLGKYVSKMFWLCT